MVNISKRLTMAAIAMIILGEGKTWDGMGLKMIQTDFSICQALCMSSRVPIMYQVLPLCGNGRDVLVRAINSHNARHCPTSPPRFMRQILSSIT